SAIRARGIADENADRANKEKIRANLNAATAQKNLESAERARKESDRHLYVAHMNLAQQSFELNEPSTTIGLLEQHILEQGTEDLRDFEWQYWWQMAHTFEYSLAHDGLSVHDACWSPDGKTLAVACSRFDRRPGQFFLWDTQTWKRK